MTQKDCPMSDCALFGQIELPSCQNCGLFDLSIMFLLIVNHLIIVKVSL